MQSFQKKATFCVLLHKNVAFFAFFYILCKRTLCSLRSFTFFAKECCVLCVLLRSLQKNIAFFAFFYILCKRTLHSLHSFTFLRKEHKRTHPSFGSRKSPKTRKNNIKERCVLLTQMRCPTLPECTSSHQSWCGGWGPSGDYKFFLKELQPTEP